MQLVVSALCLAPFAGARLGGLSFGRKLLIFIPLHGPRTLSSVGGVMTGMGSGSGFGVGAALKTHPPGRRDSNRCQGSALPRTERDGPSLTWQKGRLRLLSRKLWSVPALQGPLSPLSTLHIPCNWQRGFQLTNQPTKQRSN